MLLTVDGQSRRFPLVAAPPIAERRLDELCRASRSRRPELLWCDSLGGKGGASVNGAILIGARDQVANAERVAREIGCDMVTARTAAFDVALAHELGHAAMHELGKEHGEDDADAWALSACELAGFRTPAHDAVVGVIKKNRAANRERKKAFVDGVGLGQVPCSVAAVRGIEGTTPNFRARMIQVALAVGMDPDHLAAIISFETGGSFSPSERNPGSGATGLIQFTESTARRLGTTTDLLAIMTAEEQLDYVERYFVSYIGRLTSLCSAYAAVFAPARCIGKSADATAYAAPDQSYYGNQGLDANNDGVITCGEMCAQVESVLARAGANRIDSPCEPTASTQVVSARRDGLGAGTVLLGLALIGAGVTYPYWRGAVGL